ncbi:MAG: hypothetical protein IBJ10_01755 [Phycisphaerales bacterium]|nr:hypothetical protein [Phycisphaerales bacterium]
MRSGARIQIFAAIVAILALAASGGLSASLSAAAGRAQLGYADRAEVGDPPEVAVAIALGAFRGIFVNMLWLRANKMKEQGKFYESIELARTITRLQPRFPRVWVFQAWNMAYNISVSTKTPEERWLWVKSGIDLLRKEGIPKNPHDTLLHKELAWIFNHKIQGYADDANQYYKRRVAEEWTYALGRPPPRAATAEQTKEAYIYWLSRMVDAPDTLEAAIQREPKVAVLVQRLRDEAKLPLNIELLRAFELHMAMRESWAAREGLISLSAEHQNRALIELLSDESLLPAWPVLLTHVRKRLVLDEFRMEPARMLRYTRKYGPLDWRHPSTHALYWALRGVEEGMDRLNTQDFDLINTDRFVLHAVQELARWGDLEFDPLTESYSALPNLDFFPVYAQILRELEDRAEHAESRLRIFTTYGSGYENFMRDAVRYLYRSGDIAQAQKYFEELRNWPGLNLNDTPKLLEDFSKPLAQFVQDEVRGRIDSPQVAIQEIDGAIQNAMLRGLMRNDQRFFQGNIDYARWVHGEYMKEQLRRTQAGGDMERMELFPRSFEDAAAQSLVGLLVRGRLTLDQAALVYRRAPIWLQQPAFDPLREQMVVAGGIPEEMFARWFPEPANMAAFRENQRLLKETDDRARKADLEIERR